MSSHIEWAHPNFLHVAGIAEPGEFENDGSENEAACIVIVGESGDGMCIEGPPDDLVAIAHRILNAANAVKSDSMASPKLRSLYGLT